MKSNVVTPQQVEARLLELSKELDNAHRELNDAEHQYHAAKSDYEIAIAKCRLRLAASAERRTVQEREDAALTAVQDQHVALGFAEATVKAARANTMRIRIQVDIARSIGTSVRSSLEL